MNSIPQRRPVLRRRAVLGGLSLALGSAVILSGCQATPEPAGDPVTLTVWTWSNEAREALEDGVLEVFEEANPTIDVEVLVQPDKDYQTLLTTGLAGSGGPDIAAIRSYGVISSFAESGNLTPIDDIITDWAGFSDTALAGVTARGDGQIYAVPQGMQTAQVYYNKTIFDDLGLDVPTTWDEFLEVSEEIKASGVAPIVIPGAVAGQIALAGEVLGNARRGGPEFTQEFVAGDVDLTDDASVASIELMQEIQPYLVDNVTSVTLDEAVTIFATGMAAMYPSGTWQVSSFANLGADLDYGTFNVPVDSSWPSDEVTVAYGDGGWALSARTEHPDEAAVFLNWLASAEFAQLYANKMSTIPARDGVTIENEYVAEMYDRFLANPSTYLGLAYLRYGTPWGTDIYGEQVQKIWLGEQDAAGAADAIQTGIDAWFDPADFAN
ncbi:ABC transporter substrate-binding protein [Salinibacterium soli]|uniref:Sugar ABC transporter substrate-binding protein n=1 Tax=Antiquaquibacter soli TaxID=3064523 RepID=A0ABT9BHW2_9MICO|nr:sugar ABC transporter substrate-binding protein [Protaetiibacter sp. WY-16]MDO7880609.1 sugar ABC transporter substrate-binding protein [Protaetiibacter sp. WY-16]